MFDIAPTELLIVALVALVVIGPKDLPNVMRTVGHWVGRARGMARHFRSGIDTMIREAELEEMERKWKAENERIMREYPQMPAAVESLPPPASGELPHEPAGEPLPDEPNDPTREASSQGPASDDQRRDLS